MVLPWINVGMRALASEREREKEEEEAKRHNFDLFDNLERSDAASFFFFFFSFSSLSLPFSPPFSLSEIFESLFSFHL